MTNGKTSNNNFFLLILKIIIGIILVFITLITVLFLYIFIPYIFEDKITHTNYVPPKNGERASVITGIEIKNKGHVTFFYWPDGSLAIWNVGPYQTIYDCYYVDKSGKRTKYMGTSELYFGLNSPYKKWFPFEIKNLKDFENNYDLIIKVIESFPKSSSITVSPVRYKWKKDVRQVSNPNYVFQVKTWNGKQGSCDLFQFRQK